ncbi:MAG: hypothetical protein K2O89_02345 [Clostridia bacterium]|nr:hypothetical protein [Clostridia bacterium]
MARLYNTRKQAKEACNRESEFAITYAERAVAYAEQGFVTKAWNCADTAKMAADSAMKAHDELWELSKGNLTEAEFEAFEKAEIAQAKARMAINAAAKAGEKAQAEFDAQRKHKKVVRV